VAETDCAAGVLAIPLDSLVRNLQLERVCWIKMDIEGAEVEALKGATKTLQEFSPALFIEVHGTLGPLEGLLEQLGYAIERSVFDDPPDRHGWVLAVHPRVATGGLRNRVGSEAGRDG